MATKDTKKTTKKSFDPTKTTAGQLRKDAEFRELCSWIELNIFNYNDKQKLHKDAVLALSGLRKGQTTANNSHDVYGDYPVEVILLTFKANKNQILNGIRGKNFDSEARKMRYVCAIVRDKINDMYTRWINAKKVVEESKTAELTEAQSNEESSFTYEKEEVKTNNILEELW